MPFVTVGLITPELDLLLMAMSTGMWLLGGDQVTLAQLDLAQRMLLFVNEKAPKYLGTYVQRNAVALFARVFCRTGDGLLHVRAVLMWHECMA